MRIRNKRRSLPRELWSKRRTLKACQPKCTRSNFRIGSAKHFKSEIGNNIRQWNRGMVDEVLGAKATSLLASETNKVDGAAWPFARRECPRQLQHSYTTRSIVVSPVKDLVAGRSLVNPEMVQVRAEHDRFTRRIRTAQHADRIPGCT